MSATSKCYTITVEDRTYSSWTLLCHQEDKKQNEADPSIIDPLNHKLFHGDIFTLCTKSNIQLLHSPTRHSHYLCGILVLEGNKTYGRTDNKKRLLYRVIPDQKQLPPFLVPYEIIHAFHKAHTNKYILFQFDHWTSSHPHGILTEVLGDVACLPAHYEYQMYSKQLNGSIKDITTKVQQCTKKCSVETYMDAILHDPRYAIEDRTHINNIITIDSLYTRDFDDALHVNPNNVVTVYLANVTFWMEHFQLWEDCRNRVATVYLPDRRRPLLPSTLSEKFCSLQANQRRFAFAIDFHIQNSTISHATYHLTMIRVAQNYVYDDVQLTSDTTYQTLLQTSPAHITSSHELVSHWMVETNKNQTWMISHMIGQRMSDSSQVFLDHWTKKVEYINVSMRSIRKLQTSCAVLHHCTL